MISLNITTITDEIFALTALQRTVSGGDEAPAALSRDNLPALRVMVRAAFVSLAAQLSPYVVDTHIDEGNPAAERPYNLSESVALNIDFGDFVADLSTNELLLLRRQLEHILALLTLARLYGEGVAAKSTASAEIGAMRSVATEAAALIESLRSRLEAEPFPAVIRPCYV